MVAGALAATIISAITPLVVKGATAVAKTAGDIAAEKATAMLNTLKDKFRVDGEAAGALKRFEANPERYKPIVEDILAEKITSDPQLSAELSRLLNEMGASLKVIQEMGDVSGEVTGVEASEIRRGANVTVDQKAGNVSGKITGARVDRIG
ncbi:MAG: hypothetical protein HYY34_01310 [Chloroflexi bacterium]|nr:hypothetical protein [Chloroflexota bacterium]